MATKCSVENCYAIHTTLYSEVFVLVKLHDISLIQSGSGLENPTNLFTHNSSRQHILYFYNFVLY